jgi:DNA repair exonuclease SbcCD ATPase subunit
MENMAILKQYRNTSPLTKSQISELRLKGAEETNKQLNEELELLKAKVEAKKSALKAGQNQGIAEFVKDLDRLLDEEGGSFIGAPVGLYGQGLMTINFDSEYDKMREYDFKITILESDYQSLQTENNTLVQTVLKLKQDLRCMRSNFDDITLTLANQDINELTREIQRQDDLSKKLELEILELSKKKQQSAPLTLSNQKSADDEVAELRLHIFQGEQNNNRLLLEIRQLREKILNLQKTTQEERSKGQSSRAQVSMDTGKEAILTSQMMNRLIELNNKYKELYDKEKSARNKPNPDIALSKESLAGLKKNNERLMEEVYRLNEEVRLLRANGSPQGTSPLMVGRGSPGKQADLSISRINAIDQSADLTYDRLLFK